MSKSSPTLNKRGHELIAKMVQLQLDHVEPLLTDPQPADIERIAIAGNQLLDLAQIAPTFEMSQDYSEALKDLGYALMYITQGTALEFQKARNNYLNALERTIRNDQ